jgi:hypothetical protein
VLTPHGVGMSGEGIDHDAPRVLENIRRLLDGGSRDLMPLPPGRRRGLTR